MKIKVNEIESYEIKMPTKDITLKELEVLTERFNRLYKLFKSEMPLERVKEAIKDHSNGNYRPHKWTRNDAISVLRIKYSKRLPKERKIEMIGAITPNKVNATFLKKKFGIRKEEYLR